MNDDFEQRLQALRPQALPEAWRAKILEKAKTHNRKTLRPPRWLLVGWSLALAARVVLRTMTPPVTTTGIVNLTPAQTPSVASRVQIINALMASNLESQIIQP